MPASVEFFYWLHVKSGIHLVLLSEELEENIFQSNVVIAGWFSSGFQHRLHCSELSDMFIAANVFSQIIVKASKKIIEMSYMNITLPQSKLLFL